MVWLIAGLVACNGDQNFQKLEPNILITPEVLDFGAQVEDYTWPGAVEILNGGQGKLSISGIDITSDTDGVYTLGDLPGDLGPDERYSLPVYFTPPDPLTYTATLTVHSNDPDKPDEGVTLTGSGTVAPTPKIECDTLSMDFDTVPVGTIGTKYVTCTNVGDDDLFISSMTQTGSGAFHTGSDPTGYTLPPDQAVQLIVLYIPTLDTGDNGLLTLATNDPLAPETQITLVGNGGGDFQYPVAVVTGPATAQPRQSITVDGGGSYDPNGYEPLTYTWTVTGPYDGVETVAVGDVLSVQLDLAGEYRVSLQVTDTIGLVSAPAVYTVNAVPTEQLHVELIWNDLPDLDLHLIKSGGEMFVNPTDCNYCNVAPDWGVLLDSTDDPSLDLDARSAGVENINIDSPVDDTYSVKVHYFEDNGGGDVTATVNIYLYGVLEGTYSRVMSRNKVWDVAQIVWPDGYVLEESTDLYAATKRTCE